MEDLPEALLEEIVKRIATTRDLNSLSLVSKRLYMADANQRGAIRLGCSLFSTTETLASLCSRFSNLSKMEIDYTGHGLTFFSYIDDSSLGCLANCKKLRSLTLNSVPSITSRGLRSVVVGCKCLSALQLINCKKIGIIGWLEYLGCHGSLEEFVVKHCDGITQLDLLKFGPGWMKLRKFEFETKGQMHDVYRFHAPLYEANNPSSSRCDFSCESLTDLRLVCIKTGTGLGLLLGKCSALQKLCLEHVEDLNYNEMIALSRSCSNLRSISLWLMPQHFTGDILKAWALSCSMLQTVELTFYKNAFYEPEMGFTLEGLEILIQSCPVRVLVLRGAELFDDEGMLILSSAPFLETLELADSDQMTDAGMHFIAHAPCLSSLTLRLCSRVTDAGLAELVRAQKLESLIIEGCARVSAQVAQGAARSVHYSLESASGGHLNRI